MKQAEQDALNDLRKQQEEEEAAGAASSDDEEEPPKPAQQHPSPSKWGADWEDEEREKKRAVVKTRKKIKAVKITSDEKELLLQEFRTCLYTKFLDGLDADFDYR